MLSLPLEFYPGSIESLLKDLDMDGYTLISYNNHKRKIHLLIS